jgi:oligosaccharide repeat unit polymerase
MLPDGYGVNVFEGIFAYFSDYHEKIDEMTYVRIGDTIYTTNVYTLFEPIIRDFGILGSFLVIALLGFVAGAAACRLRERRIPFVGIYIVLSGFILFSFVGSMYKFLTNIVVSLVLMSYFYFSREKVTSIISAIAGQKDQSGREETRPQPAVTAHQDA